MSLRRSTTLVAALGLLALPAFSSAELIYGLTSTNELVTFDSAAPQSLLSGMFITGLSAGDQLLGIDFRPANNQLYALSSGNRLYTINTSTGAATAVGSAFSPTLSGSSFGWDFNPTVDRVRVVSDTRQNLRIDPSTGAVVAVDSNVNYVAGDPNASIAPAVSALAYTNNFVGATTTTLYGIDAVRDTLVVFSNPNAGTISTAGSLGINITGVNGFDISGSTGIAYAALQTTGNPGSALYTINLATGVASPVNTIGAGGSNVAIIGLSAASPVPEPATMALFGIGLAGLAARRRRKK